MGLGADSLPFAPASGAVVHSFSLSATTSGAGEDSFFLVFDKTSMGAFGASTTMARGGRAPTAPIAASIFYKSYKKQQKSAAPKKSTK
jgi:hypothetical protein